jgi:uncharacterized membrane protein YqiK
MSDPVLVAALLAPVAALCLAVVLWRCRVRVGSGQAAIVHRVGRSPEVVLTDVMVFPWLGHAELVDLKVVAIELAHSGNEGVHCRDAIKASLTVRFTLRLERNADSILQAASLVGADRVTDPDTIHRRFAGKFAEAIAGIVSNMGFQDLLLDRQHAADRIMEVLGTDLQGWTLDEVAISRIDQVPIEMLDPNELLGARAILRITEETTRHRVQVARLEADARLEEQRAAQYASS